MTLGIKTITIYNLFIYINKNVDINPHVKYTTISKKAVTLCGGKSLSLDCHPEGDKCMRTREGCPRAAPKQELGNKNTNT